jgi:DNA polymerase-1
MASPVSLLLHRLKAQGFALSCVGLDTLRVAPADGLTNADRITIRDHKQGLLELLQRNGTTAAYRYVRTITELSVVITAINGASSIALDTETTGLDPRADRARLLTLAVDFQPPRYCCQNNQPYILDAFAHDLSPLFKALAGKTIIAHNAAFDLGFLARMGFTPSGPVQDTYILSQLLHAGTPTKKGFHGLDSCLERELGVKLDKAEQKSDWSAPELSEAQLSYAAGDVQHLPALYDSLKAKIKAAGMEKVADIEMRCLPALVWLAGAGVEFDSEAWTALAQKAEQETNRLAGQLEKIAPGINWNSHVQVKTAFAGLGVELADTQDGTLARVDHPAATLLRTYRSAKKLVSTYGLDFLNYVQNGRAYCSWHQCGARTGRMSSSKPNLQNLPRNSAYRHCFIAPPGRVLVKADYSQIELRIAAKISGDRAMLQAYRDGLDLHTLTAQRLLNKSTVSKQDRQLAKSANFGLLYGQGAPGYQRYARSSYGVELTKEQAAKLRDGFFAAYPGLARWHQQIHCDNWQRRVKGSPSETRTLIGRRVLTKPDLWFGPRANFMIQGSGGDGLKTALALLWERREQVPGAFPVLVVHDEIVVECDAGQAKAVAKGLRQAMLDGMQPLIEPVPVDVEVKIGRTWGDMHESS